MARGHVEHFIRQSYIFISDDDQALRLLLGILMVHFATILYYHASLLPAGTGFACSFLLCTRPSRQFLSLSFSHKITSHLLKETAGSLKAMKSMTNLAHNFYVLVISWCPPECYHEVNGLSEAVAIRQLYSGQLALGLRSWQKVLREYEEAAMSTICGRGGWELQCQKALRGHLIIATPLTWSTRKLKPRAESD